MAYQGTLMQFLFAISATYLHNLHIQIPEIYCVPYLVLSIYYTNTWELQMTTNYQNIF